MNRRGSRESTTQVLGVPGVATRPDAVGPVGVVLLGTGLLGVGLLLVALLINVWPAVEQTRVTDPVDVRVALFGTPLAVTLTADTALLVLVILASALGGFVHAATSFATYVGNRRLARSWIWWYLLRIISGVALAVLFYFAVRGGLISAQAPTDTINPYGVGALAAMVGLFSKQATDKLREVFETLFRTAEGYGDDERKDKATNPQPRIVGVEPKRVPAGSGATVLSIQGQGFIPTSVAQVSWPGRGATLVIPRSMRYLSSTEIRVGLVEEDLAQIGEIELTIVNPEPGGGQSNPVVLEVHDEVPESGSG